MGMSKDVIEWAIAMILVGTLGITGLSIYINETTTGGALSNADSTVTLIVGTVFILLAVIGLALKFMPSELKGKIGLWTPAQLPATYTVNHSATKTQQKQVYSVSNFEQVG